MSPRSEIDVIIRVAHLNDKAENDILSSAMVVKGKVDSHAFFAGSSDLVGGEDAGSGQRGTCREGGRHEAKQQQQ